MKKILIALVLSILFATPSYAVRLDIATRISADTVTFNTVAQIVTFDTVATDWVFINNSPDYDVHITLTELGWNRIYTNYELPTLQRYSTAGTVILKANSNLEIDFATDMIGIMSEDGSGTLQYIATTETIIQP